MGGCPGVTGGGGLETGGPGVERELYMHGNVLI